MSPHTDFETRLSVLCCCGCVYYLKRVSVMPEMSVWGRPRELILTGGQMVRCCLKKGGLMAREASSIAKNI